MIEVANTIQEIIGYQPMSAFGARIDQYCQLMNMARRAAEKDPEKMAPIITHLMEEFYSRQISVLDVKRISIEYGIVKIRYVRWCNRQKEKGTIFIDGQKWTAVQDNGLRMNSMHAVCEDLAMPAPYLVGVSDCAKQVMRHQDAYKEKWRRAVESQYDRLVSTIAELTEQKDLLWQDVRALQDRRSRFEIKRTASAHPNTNNHKMPFPNTAITINEVRRQYKNKSGIYIAFQEATGDCVYVGKSKAIGRRVSSARKEISDCVFGVVEIPEKDITWAECFYIWHYRPSRNADISTTQTNERNTET